MYKTAMVLCKTRIQACHISTILWILCHISSSTQPTISCRQTNVGVGSQIGVPFQSSNAAKHVAVCKIKNTFVTKVVLILQTVACFAK